MDYFLAAFVCGHRMPGRIEVWADITEEESG
jgi:hypothetical protein